MNKLGMNKRGEVAVELIVKTMLVLFLVYTFMQMIPIITIHTNMSYAAEALARTCELTGQADYVNNDKYQDQLQAYKDEWEFMRTSTITIQPKDPSTGWWSASDKKFKFRAPFTLNIEYTYRMNIITPTFGPAVGFDIPIRKTAHGTSEIYWKTT